MSATATSVAEEMDAERAYSRSPKSGVSWGAIFAGATAAAALTLVLTILGFGLGLSAISPWASASASAQSIGVGTIVWIAFTQLAAAGLGGYLAGRLRVRWHSLHTDEVYFRDTAHGLLAWGVASLVTAALLGSAIAAALGTGIQAGTSVASGAGIAAASAVSREEGRSDNSYFVDFLFRTDSAASASATPTDTSSGAAAGDAAAGNAPPSSSPSARREAATIFATDLRSGNLTAEDKSYLAQLVSRQTGLAPADADKRVSDAFAKAKGAIDDAKQTADKARKAAAYSALWMFVALMCGAFFASFLATVGGRRRDLFA